MVKRREDPSVQIIGCLVDALNKRSNWNHNSLDDGEALKFINLLFTKRKIEMARAVLKLPDNLPIDFIGSCPECGNLFLRLSRKPKIYCSVRCTSVALARKRRGEPGTDKRLAYNRKQAEIMKERYAMIKAKMEALCP